MRGFDYTQLNGQKWDGETLLLVGNLHELKGRQELYVLQKPTEWGRVKTQSLLDCVAGACGLSGFEISAARLRALLSHRGVPKTKEERLAVGYGEVLRYIRENDSRIPVKASYLLDLHRQLFLEIGGGGRFKDEQNYMSEVRADGRSYVRFLPPSPYDTPEAVFSLCNALSLALELRGVDPLFPCFAFLGDFLCVYPFNEGNEQTAFLLLTLLLLRCGWRVVEYVSIEKIIARKKEEYYEALKQSSRGWYEGASDVLPLVKFFLRVLLEAHWKFESRVSRVAAKATAFTQVQAAVAERSGGFTKREILLACPSIGRASVENALRRMVESGELVRHGVGKATYYTRY